MKKILIIFSLFLITFSLFSCNKQNNHNDDALEPLDKFDIVKTKEIVLGNAVDSVTLTTREGEKITINNTANFFEIFNKIGFEYEDGKMYSCSAEIKLQDKEKAFVNMNNYNIDGAGFFEFRVKKDGDDAVAAVEEYSYQKQLENNKLEGSMFSRYIYKGEKAFSGFERGENGNITYKSDAYPATPEFGTELYDMQFSSNYLRSLFYFIDFFECYEPHVTSSKTYDFNELATREYKLYENYIVFKQTAPFLNADYASAMDPQIAYLSLLNSECSVIQEAYCNIETGEIELIKVYGNTAWHTGEYWGKNLEINMQIYVHDIGNLEGEKKIANLVNYVKSNID